MRKRGSRVAERGASRGARIHVGHGGPIRIRSSCIICGLVVDIIWSCRKRVKRGRARLSIWTRFLSRRRRGGLLSQKDCARPSGRRAKLSIWTRFLSRRRRSGLLSQKGFNFLLKIVVQVPKAIIWQVSKQRASFPRVEFRRVDAAPPSDDPFSGLEHPPGRPNCWRSVDARGGTAARRRLPLNTIPGRGR